ncbi:RDD family protein [Spirosoma fluminis]
MFIDLFFFYVIVLSVFFVAALINPAVIDGMANVKLLVERLVVTLLLVTYYVVFEGWLKKTPGKLITRTKVVTTEGETPTLQQLIGRNLARIIPFDAFTFIRATPVGMHDQLADTLVVDDQSVAKLSE